MNEINEVSLHLRFLLNVCDPIRTITMKFYILIDNRFNNFL